MGKDPEEFRSPPPLEPFQPTPSPVAIAGIFAFAPRVDFAVVLCLPNPRTVISTEAAHVFCEQRSGEIRFSQGPANFFLQIPPKNRMSSPETPKSNK
jgi:hypothetical protein